MNVWLEGFGKQLMVAGFRNVRIGDVNQFLKRVKDKTDGVVVQFFDASLIAGAEHLRFAALNALNAFKSKVNISDSVAMETLLYASSQRQIKEALMHLGIGPSTDSVAVLVLAETSAQAYSTMKVVARLVGGRRDDSVLDLTDAKAAALKKLFDISEAELESKAVQKGREADALIDLIIEHLALLVTQR